MPEGKAIAPNDPGFDHDARPAHCKLGCGRPLSAIHALDGDGCPGLADGPIVQVHQVVQMGGAAPTVIGKGDQLLLFLYLLLRDGGVPMGEIERYALEAEGMLWLGETSLSNPFLADYAANIVGRIAPASSEQGRDEDTSIRNQIIGWLRGRARKYEDERANCEPEEAAELRRNANVLLGAADALEKEDAE